MNIQVCVCSLNKRIYKDGLVLMCSLFWDVRRVTDGLSRNVGIQPRRVTSLKNEDLNCTAVEA